MRIVLLDLEGTVIDNWEDRNAIPEHLDRIKSFLRPDDEVGLMSWAIWGNEDREKFKKDLQAPIEDAIGHSFDPGFIFTMTDFSDIILRFCRKWISRDDMFDLFAKEECLLKLLRVGWFPEFSEVILIDDTVDHNLSFKLGSRAVRFINVGVFEW